MLCDTESVSIGRRAWLVGWLVDWLADWLAVATRARPFSEGSQQIVIGPDLDPELPSVPR